MWEDLLASLSAGQSQLERQGEYEAAERIERGDRGSDDVVLTQGLLTGYALKA